MLCKTVCKCEFDIFMRSFCHVAESTARYGTTLSFYRTTYIGYICVLKRSFCQVPNVFFLWETVFLSFHKDQSLLHWKAKGCVLKRKCNHCLNGHSSHTMKRLIVHELSWPYLFIAFHLLLFIYFPHSRMSWEDCLQSGQIYSFWIKRFAVEGDQ